MKKRKRHSEPAAFTLIEVLVVIAVVGVLIAILVPAVAGARRAAQATASRKMMESIRTALVTYERDMDRFPPSDYEQTSDPLKEDEWQGAEILTQALMGHLSVDAEDTPSDQSDGDGKKGVGFRLRTAGQFRGTVYGPYITPEDRYFAARWDINGNGDAGPSEWWGEAAEQEDAYIFRDYWGSPILYYAAEVEWDYDRIAEDQALWDDDTDRDVNGRFLKVHNDALDGDDPMLWSDDPDEVVGERDESMLRSAEFVLYGRGRDQGNGDKEERADDMIVTGP
jgi:prepilin-type N-terminal cleavage/methylation domain-containing protein